MNLPLVPRRSFLKTAVKSTSPNTKIILNVPCHRPGEELWIGHPMLNGGDGLFAESLIQNLFRGSRPRQINSRIGLALPSTSGWGRPLRSVTVVVEASMPRL